MDDADAATKTMDMPFIFFPCISTLTTLPLSTSDKNSEKIILFFWEIEPWGFLNML